MKLWALLSFLFATKVVGQNIFYNYTEFINQSIEKLGFFNVNSNFVTYQLYTRNSLTPVQLESGKLTGVSQIRPGKKFKFIIHGYLNNANFPWVINMKNEFMKKDDLNVISVNWSRAASVLYPLSAGYTKSVGEFFGKFLYDLNTTLGVPFENMHLVGHSLGAHVSGFAGKFIQKYGYKVARISGCDPAGPLFNLASNKNKLSSTDAFFVDVIHTDGFRYGHYRPLGHVDFYPNGGVSPQAGCNPFSFMDEFIVGCSHTRSHQLYTDSINSNLLVGSLCQNSLLYVWNFCKNNPTAVMGENVNQSARGIYQLTTNKAPPYGRNGTI